MINGQHIPHEPYTPDFKNKLVAREYMSLMMMIGREFFTNTIALTMEDYINGNSLFAFNFAPDLMLTGYGHPARLANISMDIKFVEPLPKNIVCYCSASTIHRLK
jgi:hypothetical protein